ncbi:MAG: hypothetical protein IJO40_14880 [Thermoguttaceae bacterium]|nr:hypothetical protein [Thermoguttaceae bacterium]
MTTLKQLSRKRGALSRFLALSSALTATAVLFAPPTFAQDAPTQAPSSVRFTVDATKRSDALIGNKVAVVNVWSPNSLTLPAKGEGGDLSSFVETVQLMQATGGSAERDLFVDPANLDVLDDYRFDPLVDACRRALQLRVKPWIKLSVPAKFSRESKVGVFGVDVLPPDDYDVYYRYVRALARKLVDEFGLDEVRSWRFGVLTEFENGDWFKAADGTPESSRAAFFKLYDYSVAALDDELGGEVCVTAHAMACTEGLWDERDFFEHCAKGVNAKTGKVGTRLNIFAVSFYDDAPGKPHPMNLAETVDRVRAKARECGLNDVVFGVDEGRILASKKGAKAGDLTWRIVGQTYQAAYDARLFKIMLDNDVKYFSAWSYSSGSAWNGYPLVAQRVAENVAKFKDSKRLETTAKKTLGQGVECDAVAAFDESTQTLRLTAFNFKDDLEYADALDAEFAVSAPFWAGRDVKIVEKTVDDRINFFPQWLRDKAELGISDDVFPWSPDSGCLDSGIYDAATRQLYFEKLRPKYVEIANRPYSTERTAKVGDDGRLTLQTTLARHGVVFYEISPVNPEK